MNITKNEPKSFICGQSQSHEKGHGHFAKNNSYSHKRSFDRNEMYGRVYTHGHEFTRGVSQRTNNDTDTGSLGFNVQVLSG